MKTFFRLICAAIFVISMLGLTMQKDTFVIHSSAFEHMKAIPTKYANTGIQGGKNISLPLSWEHIPQGTQSFAISIVDLHPIARSWVHWMVVDIPPTVTDIPEGASGTKNMPAGAREIINSFGDRGYGGPQPPKGTGPHNYEITLYALNVKALSLDQNASLSKFTKTLEGKVLAISKIIGIYERM